MTEPAAEPGWYPVGNGTQRYWDGTQWTDHIAPTAPSMPGDDKTWAILSHVLTFVGGFIAPLVIYLIKKDESPFVRQHAVESLNFQISVTVYTMVAFLLVFLLVGFFLLPLLGICTLILVIVASIKASEGHMFRYPLTLRLIS